MTVKYSDGNDKTSPTDCKSPNQVSGSGGGWGELSLHPNRQSNTLVKGEMHFKAPGPFYYKITDLGFSRQSSESDHKSVG